ncbi:MAG: ABC transporter ATP-binding protein [Bacteroidales bacterium]
MNNILEVETLKKSFKSVAAVRGISFSIAPGEVFAFLGPNGAGKTTTLRILLDIIKADQGAIRWNLNGKIASLPDPSLLGYLPEERGLYLDLPVIRILVYLASIRGMHPADARVAAMEWLERLELADRAKEKLQALSKGNQQKVQFVAAILHKPAFAILDEPFSGLDPINQEKFIEYIQEINRQGTTVLLSSHQMSLVERVARKVFLLHKGQEVFYGSLTDIYKNHGQQHSLDLTFNGQLPLDALEQLEGNEFVEQEDDHRVKVRFAPGRDLNKILGQIAQLEGLANVKSQNSSLHDIYLNMVKKKDI